MKDKILKILQATWTAVKTIFIIWSDKQMIKHLDKHGYDCIKRD